MDGNWLVENLFSSLMWELLLMAGGTTLLIYAKAKWPTWAPRLLYGLAGMVGVAVFLFTLTGHGLLSRQRPETTQENVEANIKAWADTFQLGVKKNDMPEAYFAYVLTLRSGNPVQVVRAKERPGYLQFLTTLTLSPEHQALMSKLNKDQSDKVTEEITLELARSKIGFALAAQGGSKTPNVIALEKAVPITPNFDEGQFAATVDEMDSAIQLVRNATALALEHQAPLQALTTQ